MSEAKNNLRAPNLNIPILLVDDDAMVRDVVQEYLKEIGLVNVLVAGDSQKALKVIQDKKIEIALVLSDWEMPKVTGLTLLKAVRKDPRRSQLPFIMITSQRSMERFKITQAAQWRVDAYLVKPFGMELLREKIWSVMGWKSAAA